MASARQAGQRQSWSEAETGPTFGSSVHQQLELVNVAPQPKLAPQFEQLFGVG